MVPDTELAWLAGLIDGEGCFYVRLPQPAKPGGPTRGMQTRLDLQAVSPTMILAVSSIYDRLGVAYHREPPRMFLRSKRPCVKLRVYRKRALCTLVRAILPYLVNKRPEAECILKLLDASCLVAHYHYRPEELLLVEQLKALKRIT